jgi:hypothetical protein
MGIIANLYFDVIAIYEGLVFLLFAVPVVLLCEYQAYRFLCPKQGVRRAILTTIYANIVSTLIGIPVVETLDDIARDISHQLIGRYDANFTLFILCFALTWLCEALAILLFRRKLRVSKVFLSVGIVNFASYIVLGIMLVFFKSVTGNR